MQRHPHDKAIDGLKIEWGESNYVNPPFGVVMQDGKKKGATAWARKCIEEFKKGKKVVMVYPIDKWVLMLLEAGAEVRNLRDVKWLGLITDIPTVALEISKGRMTLGEYVRSMKGSKRDAVLSINDPLPFFAELLMAPYLWYKRGF